MDDETRVRFTGVLSAHYHDSWLVRILFLFLVRNLNEWQIDTSIGFADRTELDKLEWRHFSNVPDLSQVHLHLSVSVRNGISHEHFVHFVFELEVERHAIIGFGFVRVHLVDFLMVR